MIRKVITENSSYKLEQYEIELVHPGGTKEFIPIESITKDYIAIRWGMSGIYDIYLGTNTIVARSLAARRKGRCYWKVVDVDEVKKFVRRFLGLDNDYEFQKSVERWERVKPGVRKT